MSTAPTAFAAAREATNQAREAFQEARPKLAILFVSLSYPDAERAPAAVHELVGDVPIVGGSSGACVFGPLGSSPRGVSIVLLGGDDIEVACHTAELSSPELVDVVPAAAKVARAADDAVRRGLEHYSCLVFAPAIFTDGEALVAAVRKGAGARAQLAGGLTGDEMTLDRPKVFSGDELRSDRAVVTGLFTKKHVGIAARHGWRSVGPQRKVTRADGPVLVELDKRPALDVWLEDACKAGATPPESPRELALYLANHYEIGIDGAGNGEAELIARAPYAIKDDRSIVMSGSLGEGRTVRIVHANQQDLLRASSDAATRAVLQAGGRVAGALVLACSGRLAALGPDFPVEPANIQRCIGAPIGGACVFGEIARNERDVDAFFNTTVVVVAFAV